MTGTLLLDLFASIVVIGGLAAVCRLGYLVANGWLDADHATVERPSRDEIDPLAA